MPHVASWKNIGPPSTPQEVKRLRREAMDMSRRMGQPTIVRHLWGIADVEAGKAKKCPACFDDVYEQSRGDCPVCYGFGFVSVEDNPLDLWIVPGDGVVVESDTPGTDWVKAPRYGGFDKPYLTWLVEPDIAVDVFRLSQSGFLVKQFDATGYAPWTPTLGDNDLCVNVTLQSNGYTIIDTLDRFQLKQVEQVTIRGFGKLHHAQMNGQPFLVAQTFQMNKAPENLHIHDVPVDAEWY